MFEKLLVSLSVGLFILEICLILKGKGQCMKVLFSGFYLNGWELVEFSCFYFNGVVLGVYLQIEKM